MKGTNLDGQSMASRYRYGLAGLAALIGCSIPTALKIKNSGKIPFAKIGKKFIFEEEKVIAALSIREEAIHG